LPGREHQLPLLRLGRQGQAAFAARAHAPLDMATATPLETFGGPRFHGTVIFPVNNLTV
jgi:hypothetical protein